MRPGVGGTSACQPHHTTVYPPAHQESVARVGRQGVIDDVRGVVEPRHDRFASAVQDVKEQSPVAALGIHRLQHGEVGREGHPAVGLPRHQFQVCNDRVAGVQRVHREMCRTLQILVRPHPVERLTARKRFTLRNVDSDDCHGIASLTWAVGRHRRKGT